MSTVPDSHDIGTQMSELIEALKKENQALLERCEKMARVFVCCRNDVCLNCGKYKERHKGACDDCCLKDIPQIFRKE